MGRCQNYDPFLIPNIIRHLIVRVPRRGHNFDNHPHAIREQRSQVLRASCLWLGFFLVPGFGISGLDILHDAQELI